LLSLFRLKDRIFYGWVMVGAFFVVGAATWGLNNSFGVFFKSIESEFSLTRAATSTIVSLQAALGCIIAIIGGWALDRYGPRMLTLLLGLSTGLGLLLTSQTNALWQLFITYSFLLSLGRGTIYIMLMGTISRWFDKKRGLALGIASSGMGLATVIIAPFATYLISSFGWRMAYVIIGLIAWLLVIPSSKLMRKNPHEIGVLPDGAKSSLDETGTEKPKQEGITKPAGLSLLEAFRTRNFWLLGSTWLLHAFCLFLVITHIVPHATDMSISAMEAATILSLIGGSSVVGRLLLGRISDSIGRKGTVIACALLLAGAMIWLIWSQDLWMLYLFGVVWGLFSGGLDPAMAALIGDTFGMRNIGVIMGIMNIAWGIGATVGPAIGGLAFDVSESYSIAFLAGALSMLAAALLIALTAGNQLKGKHHHL